MDIKNWLRSESQSVADAIVDINHGQLLENNISGFGMKGRTLEVLEILKTALFPSIYEQDTPGDELLPARVNERLSNAAIRLNGIIRDVFINNCESEHRSNCDECMKRADILTIKFMNKLPDIRRRLSGDIQSAYDGDPAAKYIEEIILSYPAVEAICIHRMAHELYKMNVPLIPRIMSEYAHQVTGIDIHPGATIGDNFFIDHGTGVVIGETCVIGNNVKLYQGVTLGAKSFEMDENGNPVKGIKRHPNIEDDVVIYSGASILGGDTTVGKGSIIGGNVWLLESVPPYSRVYNSTPSPNIKERKHKA